MTNLQVWIPAQGASTRVENKNFREFHNGQSLTEIKIRQLLESGIEANDIYVSSEVDDAEKLRGILGFHLIKREESLLGNSISQGDLFSHFFENTPESKFVMWVQVTDPLFSEFERFISRANDDFSQNTAIVLATSVQKHAFYKGDPLNFQFGAWHKVSQNIEPILFPRWSVFLHRRLSLKHTLYHFGLQNEFIETDDPYVDIDTLDDFELAKRFYRIKND